MKNALKYAKAGIYHVAEYALTVLLIVPLVVFLVPWLAYMWAMERKMGISGRGPSHVF